MVKFEEIRQVKQALYKQSEIENNTVLETNQISLSSHVFKCKNRKICGWQSFVFPVSAMLGGRI